jgi:hypothetical protein
MSKLDNSHDNNHNNQKSCNYCGLKFGAFLSICPETSSSRSVVHSETGTTGRISARWHRDGSSALKVTQSAFRRTMFRRELVLRPISNEHWRPMWAPWFTRHIYWQRKDRSNDYHGIRFSARELDWRVRGVPVPLNETARMREHSLRPIFKRRRSTIKAPAADARPVVLLQMAVERSSRKVREPSSPGLLSNIDLRRR